MKRNKKLIKHYAYGGIEPLEYLPTLNPRPATSELNTPIIPSKVSTTNVAASQQYQMPNIDFSGLINSLNVTPNAPAEGEYQGLKQNYTGRYMNDANQMSTVLSTAGSMWGPLGAAVAGLAGLGLTASAANKTARLNRQKLGWSPGQAEEVDNWFQNFNAGGPILPPQDTTKAMPVLPLGAPSDSINYDPIANPIGVAPYVSPVEAAYFRHRTDFARNYPEIIRAYNGVPLDSEASNKRVSILPRFHERATGGDIQLSDDSFQVKGNPQVTDGNKYIFNNKFIKLDHDEVVKGNFVYSDDLMDGDESYAKRAAKLSRTLGKAEKHAKIYKDREAQNTVKWTTNALNQLRDAQELQARIEGYRNADGSTVQSYDNGGTIGTLPWDGFDVKLFQSLYNAYLRDAGLDKSNYVKEDGAWGPQTEKAFSDYGKQIVNDWNHMFGKTYDAAGNLNNYVSDEERLRYEMMTRDKNDFGTLPIRMLGTNVRPVNEIGNSTNLSLARVNQEGKPFSQLPAPALPGSLTNAASAPAGTALGNNTRTRGRYNYQSPLTVGDALQGVEVLSKFWNLKDGPERENVQIDTTPISRTSYDVRPQLFQSQRNLSNYMSGIDTNSASLRRALFNQGYANKLSTDSQILNQYQQLNNNARVQYEDRLSNQRRYNIGQQTYTNDINARNRGQYQTLMDNAFTSLGNFGEGLNRKVYANDALRVYQELYPDVADRALGALSREDLLKLLRTVPNGQ